ncbi:PREDICTED: uncharacterized protein LOC107339871 [Acropora digitifera]|uniref:uncharacterized protein LOC107339871 n=1 Tax=Acropora digitifera TaxID=70779 RepID=UPI00077AD94D|nr:PREDICTED: uncharacterized protein LOC107339871 [Acropora digitifera]
MTPEASAVVPETPKLPRGILKQNEANHKKRRVVFAGSTEARSPTSKANEESAYNVTKTGQKVPNLDEKGDGDKQNKKGIPARSNVRFSPKPSPWKSEPSRGTKSPLTEIQKLKQIPRGKPIAQHKQKKMKVQIEDSDELTMFKELFPDMKSPESLYDKSPGKTRLQSSEQTMKPPFKSKITKVRPLSRKKENHESISWFDSDSLFGFDMDDQ